MGLGTLWLLAAKLTLVAGSLKASPLPAPEDALITPGTIPLDADGNEVHAHGGALIQLEGVFFWYGTSQKQPPGWLSTGINLYSSEDLATWQYEGEIFNWQSISGMPAGPPYRIERPKIIWNEEFKYWVMWFHLDLPSFGFPAVGVAKAALLQGPFEFVKVFKPDGRSSFDMTLFQDEDDTAYLVRSVENSFLGITKLGSDYLDIDGGICSQTSFQAEGPAVFKHGPGSYYIMSSHLTGWAANPPLLWHANSPGGLCGASWQLMAQPASGMGSETTFDSQSTAVFPFVTEDGRELLMYMGDRWNAGGPGSVARASYVWLPLIPSLPPSKPHSHLSPESPRHSSNASLETAAGNPNSAGSLQSSTQPDLSGKHIHWGSLKWSVTAALHQYGGTGKLASSEVGSGPVSNDVEFFVPLRVVAAWGSFRAQIHWQRARLARTLQIAAQAVVCILRWCRSLFWSDISNDSLCSRNEQFTLVFCPSWRPRDFLTTPMFDSSYGWQDRS